MRYLVLVFLVLAGPAMADEVSPWFGSTDQTPFQMRSDGTDVEAGVQHGMLDHTDPQVQTGCAITGCSLAESSAKVLGAGHVSP